MKILSAVVLTPVTSYQFFKGNDGFRYPQGFKVEEDNGRIFLPKIGYVRYRNSRKIEGIPKNVTVREEADGWYVSIQCEFALKPEIVSN